MHLRQATWSSARRPAYRPSSFSWTSDRHAPRRPFRFFTTCGPAWCVPTRFELAATRQNTSRPMTPTGAAVRATRHRCSRHGARRRCCRALAAQAQWPPQQAPDCAVRRMCLARGGARSKCSIVGQLHRAHRYAGRHHRDRRLERLRGAWKTRVGTHEGLKNAAESGIVALAVLLMLPVTDRALCMKDP